jgi:hypothetical protein
MHDIGRELRLARITGGKTQAWVARRIGSCQARISLIERGRCPTMAVSQLHRHAAAVGLRLWIRAYPGGRRLMDAPQLALLERLRMRAASAWRWEREVPLPKAGDLRALDARISIPGCTVAIEAITRLADVQAQARAARLKRRDIGADRLVLLISATTANRRAVREAGPALLSDFPMSPRSVLTALAAGRDPGGDAVVLL